MTDEEADYLGEYYTESLRSMFNNENDQILFTNC